TWLWAIGYGLLVLVIGCCAAFLWFSPAARPETETEPAKEGDKALALAGVMVTAESIQPASARVGVARSRGKKNRRGDRAVSYTTLPDAYILALRMLIVAGGVAAFWILRIRMGNFIHICCIGALPLVLLLLIFMMLSDIKPPKITLTIGIHLVTLFIVSMVC